MKTPAINKSRQEKGERLAQDPIDVERMERNLRAIVAISAELKRHGIKVAPYFPVPHLGTPEERDYLIGRVLSYAEQGLGLREDEH